ncbi:ATP-binding protein [Halalkalibacter krulwichiae]|uniref:histidine kinase n=1 Tax=Halalkalibacter krulwichiae TaxID=199441 RepID=A0A1X9MHX9_9BACI|nr:sensor histidine kinase [Halalkalibacter krulwichiae]ARK31823.1 Sensor histidine kinase DcuS [Halalkalibacter krulwichiae]
MKITVRVKILIMSFIIVLISVMTSGWNMVHNITDAFETEIGERAIAIARTVAQMADIRELVGTEDGELGIQPIAERTRKATNVDYIVIIDMNSIRYSHPDEMLIGQKFVGGDEKGALDNAEYISRAQGTLGNAMRAFVPIMDEENTTQVGVAVVGILTPTFQTLIATYSKDVLKSLIWGLLIGLAGSLLLAHNIKRQTFGLEPYEIAKLVEERSAVMQAMDIAIIALDEEGKISFMNRLAMKFVEVQEDVRPLHIQDIFPASWEEMIQQLKEEPNEHIVNQQIVLYDKIYLLSLYPILVKGNLVGTLLTMVDRTEANRLAEELTGVKTLVDALRAQNHEYMNKLHSIAGLIQLERTDEALEIIMDETVDEESMILFLKERFNDYSVSGLLIGKRSRARELGITFTINCESYLKTSYDHLSSGDLVTIVGNLIENAFESFTTESDLKAVELLIQIDQDHLYIRISDQGQGISKEVQEQMFTYGFSTKQKEGRGIGLALVHQIVRAHDGEIFVYSDGETGTEIEIRASKRG